MPKTLRTLLVYALAGATLVLPAHAEEPDVLDTARRYFHFLDNQQLESARAMMAEDIRFEDLTWSSQAINDPDAVIDAYRNDGTFSDFLFSERLAFVSNDTAVFHFVVSLKFAPPPDSPVKSPVPVISDLMRVATVADGKIVRHMDFANYPSLQKALRKAEGLANEE